MKNLSLLKNLVLTAALSAAAPLCLVPAQAQEVLPLVEGQTIASPEGKPDPDKPFVKMRITQFAHPNDNEKIVFRTVEALRDEFGKNNFEALIYSGKQINTDDTDLVLSSVGTYLRTRNSGARDLGTVISKKYPNPNSAEGSVFVALKSRDDLKNLSDLKGKTALVTRNYAFSGYLTALGEIAAHGHNPDKFFSNVKAVDLDMRKEIEGLRKKEGDVAIVRTCFIEELKEKGYPLDDLKFIGVKKHHDNQCMTSTDLYPNWTLFATKKANSDIARRAARVLLEMPPDEKGRQWGVASDFSKADELYKTIRRGPYEYLRTWNLQRFWEEYREWILLGFLLLGFLIVHTIRASYLVRKRTIELEGLHEEKLSIEREKRQAQSKLMALQKAGALGQLSTIFAHELRQPLSAVLAYGQGLLRLVEKDDSNSDKITKAVTRIKSEAEKANDIVAKVRSYAKNEVSKREPLNLRELCLTAVNSVKSAFEGPGEFPKTEVFGPDFYVMADPLEAELAVVNLVKNASEALVGINDSEIKITVAKENGRGIVTVSDNGGPLSDEAFKKLCAPLQSDKFHGLGLGLSIVGLITEKHGGALKFTRNPVGGITARISFPLEELKKRS